MQGKSKMAYTGPGQQKYWALLLYTVTINCFSFRTSSLLAQRNFYPPLLIVVRSKLSHIKLWNYAWIFTAYNTRNLTLIQYFDMLYNHLASFPGLPRFSSSVCVQYNTRKRKSATPFLALFHFRVLYWTQTEELKRGRPGHNKDQSLVREYRYSIQV